LDELSAIACHAYLQKCSPERRHALLRYLPKKEQEDLSSLPGSYGDLTRSSWTVENQLKEIHYSWFASFLRTLPENEIRLFLSSLPEDQVLGLKKTLLFSNHLIPLTPCAEQFFRHTLYEKTTANAKDLLPTPCLPTAPLNALLSLSFTELLKLIDFLGLRDLAGEIRQIIETVKLKQIYAALSKEEQEYLKLLLQKKEHISFKRMELGKWDGGEETLKHHLRQRGLNRLAKALYGSHPSLIWHVSHRLESHLAGILLKLCTPLEHPRATDLLTSQVVELISYLQNKKPGG
jgi:hypothetical protein